jgi:hypothetical protein
LACNSETNFQCALYVTRLLYKTFSSEKVNQTHNKVNHHYFNHDCIMHFRRSAGV